MNNKHSCSLYSFHYFPADKTVAGSKTGFNEMRLAYVKKGECFMETSDGFSLTIREGDLWFLPAKKPYVSHWSGQNIEFYSIEFDCDNMALFYDEFQTFRLENAEELFVSLNYHYENDSPFSCLAYFYKLLSLVVPLIKKADANFDTILPAINFIKDNCDKNIRVSELASLCYLSTSRFYALFKSATSTSPIEYKNSVKLSKAIALIKSGETLEKICEKLNFASPSFLRRLLKKHYALSPKQIRNLDNTL